MKNSHLLLALIFLINFNIVAYQLNESIKEARIKVAMVCKPPAVSGSWQCELVKQTDYRM